MDKKCECGGKLVPCTINTAFGQMQSVTVPNGYDFPKQYFVIVPTIKYCQKAKP